MGQGTGEFVAHRRAAWCSPRIVPPSEHEADLRLAQACATGDAAAQRRLQALVAEEVPRALGHLRQPAAFADDIRQQVLAKLLVGPAPRITRYTGRGPLRAWVRVAAVRTALNVLALKGPAAALDDVPPPADADPDPELAHLRRRYLGPLKAATEKALRALPAEDRNVLRFYFVEGMTVDQIAVTRGTHKSTVSRLITRMRKTILDAVRASFEQEFGASSREFDSVMRLVQSQLEVSLERALARSRGR